MGVRATHPDYPAMAETWRQARDVAAGEAAVHRGGSLYLPRLRDQTAEDYAAYVKRATFYNASWRTIAGLTGMLFRKAPILTAPAPLRPLLGDVDMAGTPLHLFAQAVAGECLTVGRVGVLADFPCSEVETATLAEAQALGLRPTLQLYKAEAIVNWRCRRVANRHALSLVVLKEMHAEPKDEFEDLIEPRYRVLDLAPGIDLYRVRIFRVDDKGRDQQVGEDVYPLMNGAPLDFIPFTIVGPEGVSPDVEQPPLIDLFDLNLSHYRTSADYEHGCHFTGLPTPVVSGYVAAQNEAGETVERLSIGSTTAWVFPDPAAKASYLEFTGQGLSALKENLDRKEQQMAILGARMLAAEKREAETATTAAIHRTGENSILAACAIAISLGLTQALRTFADWAGQAGPVAYDLNRDFAPAFLDAATLTALVGAWQSGAVSGQELFALLKRGDVVDEARTYDDHLSEIETLPTPATAAAVPSTPKDPADV